MNSAAIATYTDEIGVLGRKKTDIQTHGVIVPAELQDELGRNWNAPAIKNGRFVFCLESPEGGRLTTVLVINGKFAERSPFHMIKTDRGGVEVGKGGGKYTIIELVPRS